MTMPAPTPPTVRAYLASPRFHSLLETARWEDFDEGRDVTSIVSISDDRPGRGRFVARQAGVLAGAATLSAVVDVFTGQPSAGTRPGSEIEVNLLMQDGDRLERGGVIAEMAGPLRAILAVERTALNLMTHLSGIATLTRRFVDAVEGTSAAIYDTRKTLPGLRVLQKYAVTCGGGRNHRMGLHDAVLIKDNHLAHLPPGQLRAAMSAAVAAARELDPSPSFVEVEVDRLAQLEAVLPAKPDVILLDNMSHADLRRAVAMRDASVGEIGHRIELEASGGVNLDTVPAIAATGVDRIAIGAITHSAAALDIGLDLD